MMDRCIELVQFYEKETQLSAKLDNSTKQAEEQLTALWETPPSPMDGYMITTDHDIKNGDLINGAVVIRNIKSKLAQVPRGVLKS